MSPHKSSVFLAQMTLQDTDSQGRRPTMTQFSGELSPPFEIVEPAAWRAPIIFNSPHSGSVYPPGFLNASRSRSQSSTALASDTVSRRLALRVSECICQLVESPSKSG